MLENNIEPDGEDFYIADLESKADVLDELQRYLIEQEEQLKKLVQDLERRLRNTPKETFYYYSHLKTIHKYNAQRVLIKQILNNFFDLKIKRED